MLVQGWKVMMIVLFSYSQALELRMLMFEGNLRVFEIACIHFSIFSCTIKGKLQALGLLCVKDAWTA